MTIIKDELNHITEEGERRNTALSAGASLIERIAATLAAAAHPRAPRAYPYSLV